MPVDVGQSTVDAVVVIGQAFVVEAKEMEHAVRNRRCEASPKKITPVEERVSAREVLRAALAFPLVGFRLVPRLLHLVLLLRVPGRIPWHWTKRSWHRR